VAFGSPAARTLVVIDTGTQRHVLEVATTSIDEQFEPAGYDISRRISLEGIVIRHEFRDRTPGDDLLPDQPAVAAPHAQIGAGGAS